MSLSLTRDQLAEILKATTTEPINAKLSFQGVEYDSREIKGGELFVALKGQQDHGHSHVEMALSRGAALCLVENSNFLTHPQHAERFLVVEDTLKAFSSLANWWRKQLKLPVIAITGSVGKTTTKEMIAAILLKHSKGLYSQKSHNNHVGVPYTICRASREHSWAVLEMGMNHAGEMTVLSKIAEPDVALITVIAPAHIEFFKDLAAIADAKMEICAGLKKGATIIINSGDPELLAASKRHQLDRFFSVKTFSDYSSEGNQADCQMYEIKTFGLDGVEFSIKIQNQELKFAMKILGRHNVIDAAAAVIGAKTLIPDLSWQQIIDGLESFTAPLMRLKLIPLKDGRKLLDDSYNANPASMLALLDVAKDLIAEKLKVGLLIGDMLELGQNSVHYHLEVGKYAASLKPQFIIAVGELAQHYVTCAEAAGIKQVVRAQTPEIAAQLARKLEFDVLLVKASRGVGLDRAVKIITEREAVST